MQPLALPEKYTLRLLQSQDYDRNFFALLSQLTVAPKVDKQFFEEIVVDKNIRIYVIEDTSTAKLVATVRLNFERKLIRGGGTVCHFEDFVVDQDYRGEGLGSFLVQFAHAKAEERGCYKILGICVESMMPFYEKQGFKKTGFVFGKYFET